MDYKYIKQLLDRYFLGNTSLEEEKILKAFFSQQEIPAELESYKCYFEYLDDEKEADKLGEDFDARIMDAIGDATTVKAKRVSFRTRLMPLFKAAAVVFMLLTLGNAVQMAVDDNNEQQAVASGQQNSKPEGPSMAKADTVKMDTARQGIALQPQAVQPN